ncbi:MAG TPA: DUF1922 domain-containing protein [Thermoplasmata archaeon]|nr:DUF1922 domain-containing protein [Thermoplasmata archaeon]
MYIVIGCSRCGAIRVATDGQRTAGCPRCGYRIVVSRARVFHRAADMWEAAAALGRVNEALSSGGTEVDERWLDRRVARPVRRGRRRRDHVAAARDLYHRVGSFTADALAGVCNINPEEAAALLERLRSEGIVYSPAPGRFAFVE